ncbi:MAG: polysaccharide deacetylase family protein [Chloroflexi bacterium]|nr:polysaccharide deacetylase family protein [Chloroflexota bacterium]
MPDAPHRVTALRTAARLAAGATAGVMALAPIGIAGGPVHAALRQMMVVGMTAVLAAIVVRPWRTSVVSSMTGAALMLVAAWLLDQASYPVAAWTVAPMLGAGAGMVAAAGWRGRATAASGVGAVLVAALLAGVRIRFGRDAVMATGAVFAVAGGVASVAVSRGVQVRASGATRGIATVVLAVVLAAGTASWVGATTPGATWFGGLMYHGPRDQPLVALTFDDGPDPPYTLEIAGILDEYGAKGTFFTVGRALEARPDVSRALLDDGQLLANQSYTHDAVGWLDPRYPELGETERAFKAELGVCPAFFRPPHGAHTPFMARVVDEARMTMVTWDVSAGDWATDDAALVARRVLAKVRPGSVILLHDGIDGKIGADRTVILKALPLILDGLRARGLQPVTLDRLLGRPGYVPDC